MKRKFLFSILILIFILILIVSVIFIKVVRQSSETIARLKKEREPHKVEISEIPLRRKRGWELFVNKEDTWDITFLNRNYYIATSGGIILLSEDGKIEDEFNTNWGLPENSFLQLLKGEDGVFALTKGGKLINLRESLVFLYNLKETGKVYGISRKGEDVLISASNGVYLLNENKVSKVEDIDGAKIAEPFLNGVVVGTIRGRVYISAPTLRDSVLEIDAVNDMKEIGGVLYIATPLGLERVTGEEREIKLTGEFITSIAEYSGKLCCGTFDGRVIIGEKIDRVTREDIPINRLRVVDEKLFALTGEGVYLFRDGKWSVFYKSAVDLPLGYITSLLKTGGELFIGTFEDGCFSLKSNRLRKLDIGRNVNEINQIVDAKKGIFIATNSGLILLNKKEARIVGGLPSHFVTSVFLKGNKLIAGTSKGFGIIDLAHLNIKNYGSFQGLINNRVYCIIASGQKIVFGTLGGISIFDGTAFKNFTSANSSLKNNWINGLIATDERVYIGTYGGGISYLDKKGIKTLEGTKGVEINHNSIFYKEPFLFAGTCRRGLFVYNEKERRGTFLKNIFPIDNVTAVFVDDEYFYIGTEQGLYRIESKEIPL